MASATLCFSGFSRDENSLIQKQFEQANASLGNRWALVDEAEARVLLIDMDSMYGHMTWLKAHGGGKTTIGLTAGERSETDFLLKRPLTVESLGLLLDQLADKAGNATRATDPAVAMATATAAVAATVAAPVAQAPVAPSAAAPASDAAPAKASPSADYIAAVTTAQRAAMAPVVAHEPRVSDFLPPGVLGGPTRLQLAGAPLLAFDPATQTYAGSATLKPLLPYVDAAVQESDFVAIAQSEFDRIKASTGGAQPYMRLLWLFGLSVGNGQLLPGFSTGKKLLLTKWPQIEREYPKHFRLATVMMKGPALIKELAELSGVAESEVIDFVNAGLLTGSVVVEGTSTTAGDVARASALLARPRAS